MCRDCQSEMHVRWARDIADSTLQWITRSRDPRSGRATSESKFPSHAEARRRFFLCKDFYDGMDRLPYRTGFLMENS